MMTVQASLNGVRELGLRPNSPGITAQEELLAKEEKYLFSLSHGGAGKTRISSIMYSSFPDALGRLVTVEKLR